jgi:hypothetical protein
LLYIYIKHPGLTVDFSAAGAAVKGDSPEKSKLSRWLAAQEKPPNYCLGMLATVSRRIDGMEAEQDVTIRELDKLIQLFKGKGWW